MGPNKFEDATPERAWSVQVVSLPPDHRTPVRGVHVSGHVRRRWNMDLTSPSISVSRLSDHCPTNSAGRTPAGTGAGKAPRRVNYTTC